MVRGRIVEPLEKPDRASALAEALKDAGLRLAVPGDAGPDPIFAVHSQAYITFLQDAFGEFSRLPARGPELLPNVHPYRGADASFEPRLPPRSSGIIGRAGWFVGDMACAIMDGTWRAAYASAQTAVAGADAVLAGQRAAYALCRPPGHHAYADRASGFCFLNNAAIAAERLRDRFERVAIIDFDTHHGDGTQSIFYARDDVFVASVHTDPSAFYPFYLGFADERGAGAGAGANLNIPLAPGSGDAAYVEAVSQLAAAARSFGAEALVISAGWDAHRDDPLSGLQVSTEAYARLGETLGRLRLPSLVVQEGGYSLAAISEAAPRFAKAFLNAGG